MQAATLDKLQREARFAPEQAIAVAEAIDMAMAEAYFLTVPILDARFAAVEVAAGLRFREIDARFATAEVAAGLRFREIDARFAAAEAAAGLRFREIDARFVAIEVRFTKVEARIDV